MSAAHSGDSYGRINSSEKRADCQRRLIGSNVTLEWQYAGHNDRANYLLELKKKDAHYPSWERLASRSKPGRLPSLINAMKSLKRARRSYRHSGLGSCTLQLADFR